MLLAGAGCVLLAFILCLPGIQLQQTICALKGSSVDLPCRAKYPTTNIKWYTQDWDPSRPVLKELAADGKRVKSMSEERNFTLTINDLTESDAKSYCCKDDDTNENIQKITTQLIVADLQVKVIPTTEGLTVTLMCSTSCRLTENPAAYIWYKNRELVYEDWSPWYQHLVSSEEAVTYSCAIKGYKHLRAPEVSVDSVSAGCINVTYAKGKMCSCVSASVDKPCSITYPREVHVQKTPAQSNHVKLTCGTNCSLTDPQTVCTLYWSSMSGTHDQKQLYTKTSVETVTCAVKGLEDLHSAAVCVNDDKCWTVNYVSRRICALKGNSVNISCQYSHPNYEKATSKSWYKKIPNGDKKPEEVSKVAGHVEHHENMKNNHTLTIKNLKKDDSAEYIFHLQQGDKGFKTSSRGVTLVVTGLKVTFRPSAVVTEGQRVTLTCSTSCPLTDTNYTWYLNARPLTLPEDQNKQLVIDPVSSQHAGNYSCAVTIKTRNISASERTLTVQTMKGDQISAAAGVCVVLLVIILLAALWWIRRKRISSHSPRNETSTNMEQPNPGPVYAEVSAQSEEPDEPHYSSVHFHQNNTDMLYSTVQAHQTQDVEHTPYAVVKIKSTMPV